MVNWPFFQLTFSENKKMKRVIFDGTIKGRQENAPSKALLQNYNKKLNQIF